MNTSLAASDIVILVKRPFSKTTSAPTSMMPTSFCFDYYQKFLISIDYLQNMMEKQYFVDNFALNSRVATREKANKALVLPGFSQIG